MYVKVLEYEEIRQAEVLMSGGEIEQETRRFDEKTGKTILMRVKEGTDDYRYFPEPDLVDLVIDDAWLERVRADQFLNFQMLVKNVMSKSLAYQHMMQMY